MPNPAAAAVSEWVAMLDQIDASIESAIEAADRRRDAAGAIEDPAREFDASALSEIDNRLRGFDDRLSHVRALAEQIETALERDERAVIEYRETAATARQRPAPARQLS